MDPVSHKNNILNIQTTVKSHWSHKESGNHNINEKRQSTNDNTKMMQILELSDKSFKATIIKLIKQLTMKYFETKDNQ